MNDPIEVLNRLKQRAKLPANREIKGIDIDPPAAALVHDLDHRPHAFLLGCIADRQILASRAWELPWHLSQRIGGFGIDRLRHLSPEEWSAAMSRPTPLHRFHKTMAENLRLAIELVCDRYDGDAARIWNDGSSSWEALRRFREFRGVGVKIANMAVNILVRDFGVTFASLTALDVAPDVQVRRVFARLGLVHPEPSREDVMYRARELNPEWPGLLDWPVWEIGKQWCHAPAPACHACPMESVCPTVGERL
ncbi:iron-sulfur cluster loop [Candidatus Palauibacter sp.]|uniref:iron-sulfur cluster loop n=1 Tax=Candidatus Palauibacter sp. TaxID=3101350 RepID=UPI003B517937